MSAKIYSESPIGRTKNRIRKGCRIGRAQIDIKLTLQLKKYKCSESELLARRAN